MNTDVRSVAERIDAPDARDAAGAHEMIARGMRNLAQRLYTAFPVEPEPAAEQFRRYGSLDGTLQGELRASSGAPLDWVIDSFIAAPSRGFCNHHLTIWLSDELRVPHLAFAVGTIPQLFFFCDLVPRSDLWVDQRELDTYHATFNQRTLEIAADPRFAPFVSREIYIRQALSPCGICVQAEPRIELFDHCFELAQQTLETWIGWVKSAPATPAPERAALATRDARVRETICRRDPANIIAERVLGKPMTDALVDVLAKTVRRS